MGDVGNLVWRERSHVLVAQHEPQPRGRLELLDRIRGGGERRTADDRAVVGEQHRVMSTRGATDRVGQRPGSPGA